MANQLLDLLGSLLKEFTTVMNSHTPLAVGLTGMYCIFVIKLIHEPGYSLFKKQVAMLCFSNLFFYPNLLFLYLLLYLDVAIWRMFRQTHWYSARVYLAVLVSRHIMKILLVDQTFWGGVVALADITFLMSIWRIKKRRRVQRNDWVELSEEEMQQHGDLCPICFDDVETGGIKLKCNHVFHLACVESWWEVRLECPLCRRTLAQMRRL